MPTDDEIERFNAGFVSFTTRDDTHPSPNRQPVIPPRRRRTNQRWLPLGHDARLPPVPPHIRFDENGEGYDSRVGRSRRRPRSLSHPGSLAQTSIMAQYHAVIDRLNELGETGDDPIAVRQLTMTEERLRQDARRCGVDERLLDQIRDGRSVLAPLPPPPSAPRPPAPPRQSGFDQLRKLPPGH